MLGSGRRLFERQSPGEGRACVGGAEAATSRSCCQMAPCCTTKQSANMQLCSPWPGWTRGWLWSGESAALSALYTPLTALCMLQVEYAGPCSSHVRMCMRAPAPHSQLTVSHCSPSKPSRMPSHTSLHKQSSLLPPLAQSS